MSEILTYLAATSLGLAFSVIVVGFLAYSSELKSRDNPAWVVFIIAALLIAEIGGLYWLGGMP